MKFSIGLTVVTVLTALTVDGLSFAVVSFSTFSAAYEIGNELQTEKFWQADCVSFTNAHHRQGFKCTSTDGREVDSRRDGGATCFGLPVYESRLSFGATGGIARVELMLFNPSGTEKASDQVFTTADGRRVRRIERLDRPMSRATFFATVEKVRSTMNANGRRAPMAQKERTRNASVSQYTISWPASSVDTVATLTWNYSQEGRREDTFAPGFIRLAVEMPSRLSRIGPIAVKSARGRKMIADNVMRTSDGDVYVNNVPMVDQGAKGYCAVSSAERVMRYYGRDVDEHEIAEVAGTTADRGTNVKKMVETVEYVGKRNGLGTMIIYGDFDSEARIAGIVREVKDYNKMAKRMKKTPIQDSVYVTREGSFVTYHLDALDKAMDAEVLKAMKTKGSQKSKYTKFRKDLRQYVDMGIPVLWGVKLGIFQEPNLPQLSGGHMRLIIGYNDKKDEIIYTDSWGRGHEFKHMPADRAWTITRSMMIMKP